MITREAKRVIFNEMNAIAAGAGLILFGIFLTVWTWGFGVVLAVPMALVAAALPFWALYQGLRGRDWLGQERSIEQEGDAGRLPAEAY